MISSPTAMIIFWSPLGFPVSMFSHQR
jgi:hypothetical protein